MKHDAAPLAGPNAVAQAVANLKSARDLSEAHEECVRELTVRRRCFPRWVEEGRIGKAESKDRLERMQAATEYLDLMLRMIHWAEVPDVTSSGDKTPSRD